jgi:hypothetical protein
MVLGANGPPAHQACTANHISMHVVHIERRPIQSTHHHTPAPKGPGRMGQDRYRGKVQDSTLRPHMDPKQQERFNAEALMSYWNLTGPLPNPPLAHRIPTKIAHFRQYNIDMAYVTEHGATDTSKLFKHRIYGALREMAANSEGATEMPIIRNYPTTCWVKVWKNLHTVEASDSVISTWYQAIHDIIPTNERLATSRLTDTILCARCRNTDTLQYRIVAKVRCYGTGLGQGSLQFFKRTPEAYPQSGPYGLTYKLVLHKNKGQSYGI